MPRRSVPPGERGAALLTVLMLVAFVAVMAGAALEKLRLATRLSANVGTIEQARGYAQVGETMATTRVTTLLGNSPDRVTLAGGWSGRPFALPLPDGGVAVARVTDGGNCFNLNGLVQRSAAGGYVDNPAALSHFVRLMRLLNVPDAERIAGSTADWIDTDQAVQPNGAEDASYLGLATPYRTAGALMADPSELRAVNGVTAEAYAQLRPWICALPVSAQPKINVNTLAPEQAPLIAMLMPDGTSVGTVQQALLQRPAQGYADAGAFWNQVTRGGASAGDGAGQTAVVSRWFALAIIVQAGGRTLDEQALIDANRLPARLVSRQWGEP